MHVDDGPTGQTTMSVAALRRALEVKLSPLNVKLVDLRVTDTEVLITVEATGDPVTSRAAVEDRLSYDFWIDLGLVDLAPRVRVRPSKRHRG
jgi:hypothetical protein